MQLLQNILSCCLLIFWEKLLENIQVCQIELDQFYELKTKGAIVQCRAKWFEKGEKNTKYFLNFEKSGFDRKPISEIKNEHSNIENDQMGILGVSKLHFEKFLKM